MARDCSPSRVPPLDAALSYIDNHRREVEAEYQTVLKIAQEIRDYWEEKNLSSF